jgi:hypothetical protein
MAAGADDRSRDSEFTPHAIDVSIYGWPRVECRHLIREPDYREATCVIYPADVDDDELRTHWISAPADHAVDLFDLR